MEQGENISFIISFFAGLSYFLSPCVLPLVPSYLSYITGISLEDLKGERSSKIQKITIIHSLLFILGFSLVFITLGASASFLGQFLARNLEIVRKIGGIIIILFGLFIILQQYLIKVAFLIRDRRWVFKSRPTGYLGSVLIGISFSAGWTACSTPVLAAILFYTSMAKTVATGIFLLSVFSLGLAIPFFLSALAVNIFLNFFDKVKKYLRIIEIISGVLLIIFGVLVFTNYLSIISAYFVRWTNWQGV